MLTILKKHVCVLKKIGELKKYPLISQKYSLIQKMFTDSKGDFNNLRVDGQNLN